MTKIMQNKATQAKVPPKTPAFCTLSLADRAQKIDDILQKSRNYFLQDLRARE
jgi:hypothetical protein